MRTRLMRGKLSLLFLTIAMLLAIPAVAAFAQDTGTSPAPTIQSDKADYAPGELVTLTGGGWQPGESVHINVNDTYGATWSRNVDVIGDASGNITDSFNLPNAFVSDYDVTATGAQSGTVTTTFTDSQPNAVSVAPPLSNTVAQGNTSPAYGTVAVDMGGNNTNCTTTLGTATLPAQPAQGQQPAQPADTGLPSGATANFTNNPRTGNDADYTSTLTVGTLNTTPTGTYTFHVKVASSANCQGEQRHLGDPAADSGCNFRGEEHDDVSLEQREPEHLR